MRLAIGLFVGVAACSLTFAVAAAATSEWERVDVGGGERSFVAVAIDPAVPTRIVATTPRTVYESTDGGQRWQQRFRLPVEANAVKLAIDPSEKPILLLATDNGLYASFDDGQDWSRIFLGSGEQEAVGTHLAFHPSKDGRILLGTHGGLFISADHGLQWRDVGLPPAARHIIHFSFDPNDPDRLYLVTNQGLWVGDLSEGRWEQRLTLIGIAEDEAPGPEADSDESEAVEEEALRHLTSVAIDPQAPSTLYLAGSRGLQMSANGGASWTRLTRSGLTVPRITRLLPYAHSPLILYAATERGVARYEPHRDRWRLINQGLSTTRVNDLAETAQGIWAATDQGLYRYEFSPEEMGDSEPPTAQDLLANFVHEPTITQVRDAAIRYAEVHPDKIKRWRRQASLQALLPSVNFGMDHDTSRDLHVDEGSYPNFQLIDTKDRDAGADLSITWDLGELIWNDDQTSIDVRSKLMVQLRDDLVDEVTRTYFERRRLQALLLTHPPTDQQAVLEKELRLQELTALIDGLTGGYFSHSMKPAINPEEATWRD